MTKQEKVIVSAYTGVLMCDFADLHEYIERLWVGQCGHTSLRITMLCRKLRQSQKMTL